MGIFVEYFLRSTFVLIGAMFFPALDSKAADAEPNNLIIFVDNEPVTLDWQSYRSKTDRFIASFLTRTLLKYDESAKLVCDLCKSFTISQDQKVLTFDLSSEEKWSDGTLLEARHFVDGFRRLFDPQLKSPHARDFSFIQGAPQKPAVLAPQNNKLIITLSKAQANFPHLLTTIPTAPLRKEFLKSKHESGENHLSSAAIGPYMLAAWERGHRIVIEVHDFSKGRPVYRVEFLFGKRKDHLQLFKKGAVDIFSNPTTEDLRQIPGQKIQVNPYWATRTLLFNLKKEILSDVTLRKAVLLALNREMLPAHLKSGDRKATGMIPPGLPGYRELPLATMNLDLARVERGRGGAASINLNLSLADLEMDRKIASWLVNELDKIQIRLKPTVLPLPKYFEAIEKGDFELALYTWSFTTASPLELLGSFQTGDGLNRGGWTSVSFDTILKQLIAGEKPEEFSNWIDQATQILEIQSIGVIPLSYPTQPFLLGPRVVNFATTTFGDPDLMKIRLKVVRPKI